MQSTLLALGTALLYSSLGMSLHAAESQLVFRNDLNYFSIEVWSGNNTVAELLPSAPEGMLIFHHDNAKGFDAVQKYAHGWSDPEFQLLPGQGYIVLLSDPPYSVTVTGEMELQPDFEIFEGLNLIGSRAIPLPGWPIEPRDGDMIFTYSPPGMFMPSQFDAGADAWSPEIRVIAGSCSWYRAQDWPENPAGTEPAGGSVYFNNFAPALGVDARFVNSSGEGITGSARLFRIQQDGTRAAIGEPAPLGTGALAGYIDPAANLVRYVPDSFGGPVDFVVAVTSGETTVESLPFTATPAATPLTPAGLAGLESVTIIESSGPTFLVQPSRTNAAFGSMITLRAIFNYRSSEGEAPAESLTTVADCGENGCPVQYQWERLHTDNTWMAVPGATSDTLQIASYRPEDQGAYRLRAQWGETEAYTSSALLGKPLHFTFVRFQNEDSLELRIWLAEAANVVFETSKDMKTWAAQLPLDFPAGQSAWTFGTAATPSTFFIRGKIVE